MRLDCGQLPAHSFFRVFGRAENLRAEELRVSAAVSIAPEPALRSGPGGIAEADQQ